MNRELEATLERAVKEKFDIQKLLKASQEKLAIKNRELAKIESIHKQMQDRKQSQEQ